MNVGFSPRWKGFSYSCPHCHVVLGVEVNPLTVQAEILDGVKAMLNRQ
jgi:hypothetical protein